MNLVSVYELGRMVQEDFQSSAFICGTIIGRMSEPEGRKGSQNRYR